MKHHGIVLLIGAALALTACSADDAGTRTDRRPGGMSLSPAADAVHACLTAKGWDVQLTWDGGIESDSRTIPDAQSDQYDADSDECWAVIDDRIASMQPDEIKQVYREELATRDCLIGAGFTVDTPPSEQQYVDTFFGTRWTAYGESSALSQSTDDEKWRHVNETCPQPSWSLGLP